MSKTINQINEEKDPEHESDAIAFKLGVEHGRKGLESEHKHQHYLEGHALGKRQRDDFPKLYEHLEPTPEPLIEDANVVGGGAIAGVGVGPQGEPGVTKSKYHAVNVLMNLMKRNRTNVSTS